MTEFDHVIQGTRMHGGILAGNRIHAPTCRLFDPASVRGCTCFAIPLAHGEEKQQSPSTEPEKREKSN
jgi:hypothetical protein